MIFSCKEKLYRNAGGASVILLGNLTNVMSEYGSYGRISDGSSSLHNYGKAMTVVLFGTLL